VMEAVLPDAMRGRLLSRASVFSSPASVRVCGRHAGESPHFVHARETVKSLVPLAFQGSL